MNNYSEDDIKNLLISLGYHLNDDGDCWRANAVFRGGSNSTSLKIYKNSGVWHDYGSNNISQSFEQLLKLSGYNGEMPKSIESDKVIIDKSELPTRIYPESILKRLLPHYQFYIDKGISSVILKRLKSGMAMSGKMYNRYVFPIFDDLGRIIGFSGRYLGTADRPKWKHIGKKQKWCYPLYVKDEFGTFYVHDEIINKKEVFLVESIGDMLSFHNQGIFNVLVVFGLNISDSVISSILSMGVDRIFICFNNDNQKAINTGLDASIEGFLKLLVYFDYESIGICLPIKNDFGDMNELDFKKWQIKLRNLNYEEQREKICQDAPKLAEEKRITKISYDNLKYLEC